MGKLHITVSSIFVLTLLVIIGCRNEVTFETTVKEQTSTVFTTTQDATCVYYYKQNKYGDTDLTSYERDTSADATNVAIKKGTALSQVAQKNFAGFSYATAVQVNDVVNVYYNRNMITYEFYSSVKNPTQIYKISGLYGTDLEIPSYPKDKLDPYNLFSRWVTAEGEEPTNTWGATGKKFYAEFLSKVGLIGNKGCADTLGDILLDDGSVISFEDYICLSESKRSEVVVHAIAVLFCTDYNPDCEIGSWNRYSDYGRVIDIITPRLLHTGRQKLIAGVPKEFGYKDIPWSASAEVMERTNFSLQDCIDGEKNMIAMQSYDNELIRGESFANAVSALTAGTRYGRDFCKNTNYRKNWYLPAMGELFVLHEFLLEYIDIAEDLYKNFSDTLWTSQVAIAIGDSKAYSGKDVFYAIVYRPHSASDNDYVGTDKRSKASYRVIPVRKIN